MKDEFDLTTEQRLQEYYKSYYTGLPSPAEVRTQVITRLNAQPRLSLPRRVGSTLFPAQKGLRTAFISLGLLVVLLSGMMIAVPPARIWAEDTVGGLLVYFGYNRASPISPDGKTVNHPTAIADNCTKAASGDMYCASGDESYIKQEQGQEKLGFNLKAPSYVPGGYVDLKIFLTNPKEKWATWSAESKDNRGVCGLQAIRLGQSPAAVQLKGGSMPVGDAPAHAVTVGNAPGLWVEKVEGAWCRQAGGNRIMQTTNFLSWEADNIRYTLYVDSSLGLDEAIKLAESLK